MKFIRQIGHGGHVNDYICSTHTNVFGEQYPGKSCNGYKRTMQRGHIFAQSDAKTTDWVTQHVPSQNMRVKDRIVLQQNLYLCWTKWKHSDVASMDNGRSRCIHMRSLKLNSTRTTGNKGTFTRWCLVYNRATTPEVSHIAGDVHKLYSVHLLLQLPLTIRPQTEAGMMPRTQTLATASCFLMSCGLTYYTTMNKSLIRRLTPKIEAHH